MAQRVLTLFLPLAALLLASCGLFVVDRDAPDSGVPPVDGGAPPDDHCPEGPSLVSPEISMDAAIPNPDFQWRYAPSVAFNGQNYLVVWVDGRDWNDTTKGMRIYGARVSPAGAVLDPQGISISSPVGHDFAPKALFDGLSTLVMWAHQNTVPTGDDSGGGYEAARVTPAGAVLDPVSIQLPETFGWGSEDIGYADAASKRWSSGRTARSGQPS